MARELIGGSQYGFSSPGASAGRAIEQFLVQRALIQRQQMLDALNVGNAQADNQRADAAEARMNSIQQQQQQDRADASNMSRATAAATSLGIGGRIDATDPNAQNIRNYLPGVLDEDKTLQATHRVMTSPGVIQTNDVAPVPTGQLISRGTSQQQQVAEAIAAREREQTQAQQAAADRAREAQQAAAERAREAEAARAALQVGLNAGKSETQGLRNDLLRTQIDSAHEKQTQTAQTQDRAKQAAQQTAGATLDTLKQLADFNPDGTVSLKPGVGNLFGLRVPFASSIPGTNAANASAALEKLKGRVIVDLLNEMKQQSRTGATGFGALSQRELAVLEGAATELSSSGITDQRAGEEFKRIYDSATRLMNGAGGGAPAGAAGTGGRVYYDANGNPVKGR